MYWKEGEKHHWVGGGVFNLPHAQMSQLAFIYHRGSLSSVWQFYQKKWMKIKFYTNHKLSMLVSHQETRYTALLFFLTWEKNWSTNYCVELKKKNPQLKAQQNKWQIPSLSIELKGFQWAHYFYYPAMLSQAYSKAVFRHKMCCVLAKMWAMDQLTWNQ